jgi:hypothetical protein
MFGIAAALLISCTGPKDHQTAEVWSMTAPVKDNERFEQVLEYRQKGDFEHAAAVAIQPTNGTPPDDFLLHTTAITYFQRAQVDQANKEEWVVLATQYSERAFHANPTEPVNTFNLADSYMTAGMNLGKPQGCTYYQRSLEVFLRLKADPALQGERGTVGGEKVLLAPYRRKLDQHIDNLRVVAATCPGFGKAQ